MKFRLTTSDSAYIDYFTNLLTTVGSLTNMAIFKLSKDIMTIIIKDGSISGGTYVQMDINISSLFHECVCVGVDPPDNNHIVLEVKTQQLLSGLRGGSSSFNNTINEDNKNSKSSFNTSTNSSISSLRFAKVKLVKKGIPALLFELEQSSVSGRSRLITHHIPVLIIPPRIWSEVDLPICPDFDLTIFLPTIKVLKSIVDRIKNLSSDITIIADSSGVLTMKIVKNSEVTIELKFNNLKTIAGNSNRSTGEAGDHLEVQATVPLKRFSQFVNSIKLLPNWIVANIHDKKILQFAVEFDYAKYCFNIPSKYED